MIAALPVLVRFGPIVVAGVLALVCWGLWGRLEAANVKLRAAEATIETKEKDAARSAEQVAKLADTISRTEAKVVTVTERIYAAPVTRECAQSPPMRAASDGLRELYARPAQAAPGRQPAAQVR